ncbi:metal ABC transporter substrate-binding protein [Arcanobacterium sp. S3PF19]|uniref:metal ABC transporter substrate-binding protein n=1 Tax=Arcanobacterium sp. S3PF19 TaxID=1219585 RepID=UPI00050F5C74|nr:metal ABC transporter substrate-binding protein [Arcanobacterium sp. S3PF19]KGF05850.1 ABC transporter [Arcanobacterium sp. S3PF19]
MNRKLNAVVAIAALAATSASLAGCSNAKDAGKASKDAKANVVKVVATTTQICDYVTQIATDKSADATLAFTKMDSAGKVTHTGAKPDKAKSEINLTCLLAPNASAHEHEMTTAQAKALASADVMLVSGVDLEHFLDSAVESTGFKGTMGVTSGILTAAEVTDEKSELDKEKKLPYKVDRGVEKVKVEKWPFPPEPGESEPEFKYDPHIWTSPQNAAIQVRNIGAILNKVSPENKELFTKHVKRYSAAIDDLDKWVKEAINSIPKEHRVLFTSHDAFGYFSKTYGINFIGAALSDFNEQQDATASHIQKAADEVKKSGALALFAENSNNSKSIEAVAKAAGVKAIIGEDALYGDSLGPVGSEGETYTGSILHNVTVIVNAWSGKLPPVPGSLK